jgi:hypothetical protein
MALRLAYDAATGRATFRDLTAEEEAQRQADLTAAAAQEAAEAQERADDTAARALVVQIAQTAVGTRFDQLTAQQVRALAAILLWREGALTATGQVRPLSEWVRG